MYFYFDLQNGNESKQSISWKVESHILQKYRDQEKEVTKVSLCLNVPILP